LSRRLERRGLVFGGLKSFAATIWPPVSALSVERPLTVEVEVPRLDLYVQPQKSNVQTIQPVRGALSVEWLWWRVSPEAGVAWHR
jgi:hypothetical protein